LFVQPHGKKFSPAVAAAGTGAPEPSWLFLPKTQLWLSILAGVLLLAGYLLSRAHLELFGKPVVWISLGLGAIYGIRAAWDAVRVFTFDIDVLMIVAAALAAWVGHAEEGALLLFLFNLSGALEELAMLRTQREVSALHKMMPTEAMVFRNGEWVEAAATELAAGDRVKIRTGERVPTDAVVTAGESSIDQSAITGESMPRGVKPGDELFAGTINTDDALEARVLRPVSQSSLQRVLDLVTSARSQREPVQRLIDRLSQPYSIGVMVLSIVVMLIWHWGLKFEWSAAAMTAITLLIVASPCALVIATPVATLCAIARGARSGVLFKGGQSLELLSNTGAVCFDKTGTLTIGRPRLYEVHPVAWSDGDELLAIAAGLEADSTHPIATAVKEAAKKRGIEPATLDSVNHTAGRGLSGVHHGAPVRLGSLTHTQDLIPICFRNRVREVLSGIQSRGHIGVVVVKANAETEASGQVAVLIMADPVRPGAKTLVDELHTLGIRPVTMLTGDNRLTAGRVAETLGLDVFRAELLPEDKVGAVKALKSELANRPKSRRGVGVIGDGVNDAPALAAADVGVAIGAIGTAAALETADIVLLSDNLGVVPWSIRLARVTRRTVLLNLILAMSVIVGMGIATLVGSVLGHAVPLGIGVLAHEGGTVIVVLHSLRLLMMASPRSAGAPDVELALAVEEKQSDVVARQSLPGGEQALRG
jgi:Cd2+/Zn2+-exporting ATPase